MRIIESATEHENAWKAALGCIVYEFAHIEMRMFLMCALFLDINSIEKIPLSKRINKAIGFFKSTFPGRSAKLISVLIELKQHAKFRNAVVHGGLTGFASLRGTHPSRIFDSEFGEIFLEEVLSRLERIKDLHTQLSMQERELDLLSLEQARNRTKSLDAH